MECTNAPFYFMEYHGQVQAGHASGKQRLLHTSVVILDFRYVTFEFSPNSLSFELPSQFLNWFLDLCGYRISRILSQLSETLLVTLTFSLQSGKCT